MLGSWKKFHKEKPKTRKPFAFFKGRRGILSYENGQWEFISGKPADRINLPAAFLKELLFMDDNRGKKRCNS